MATPSPASGTTQAHRLASTPNPESLRLDDRSEADLREWAGKLAKELRFFDETNAENGTWEAFFGSDETALTELQARAEVPPHYALFLAFLRTFGVAQSHFNGLTRRHLDFYYEKILGLSRRDGQPDDVFAVVQLAKQAAEDFLPKNTALDAGKGTDGQPRRLFSTDDAFPNQARIAAQRSVFLGANGVLHAGAPSDGRVLGHAGLPVAGLGFALTAPALDLAGGTRTITLEFPLAHAVSPLHFRRIASLRGELSGEKAWLSLQFTARFEGNSLRLSGTLPASEKAVVGYQAALGGGFPTDWPVLKVFVPAEASTFWRGIRVEAPSLRVTVAELPITEASNDFGPVVTDKAFLPFGPQPVPGSTLTLHCPELRRKSLRRLDLGLTWLNPPGNFKTAYRHYPGWNSLCNAAFTANLRVGSTAPVPVNLFNASDATQPVTLSWNGTPQAGVDTIRLENAHTFYHREFPQLYARAMLDKATEALNPPPPPPPAPPTGLSAKAYLVGTAKTIQAKDSLTSKEFVSQIFIAEYFDDGIPNDPYTPTLKTLTLGYQAETLPGELRFFHLDESGFSEKTTSQSTLLPVHAEAGQWCIGLENLRPGQALSMLVDAEEGSADPDATPPPLTWSVLAGNDWLPLDDRHLLADETRGLRQSGLLRINVPDAAFAPHTRLDPTLCWLRASVPSSLDGLCRVRNLYPHALRARGEKPGDFPAGTVTKLAVPRATVKALSQPVASGGGRPAENAPAFYRRVSERLRHKGRALSAWDYEHLVLEAFPELYQVKCLPHTTADCQSCASPGRVTLVIVPRTDTVNAHRPRASQALRARISEFIDRLTPLFVHVEVVNAVFETLTVRAAVRFRRGLAFGYFGDRLDQDVQRYLTPWAFGTPAELQFGGSLRRSALLRFMENLEYVDVVSDFEVLVEAGGRRATVEPDLIPAMGSRSVLVSAERHEFSLFDAP